MGTRSLKQRRGYGWAWEFKPMPDSDWHLCHWAVPFKSILLNDEAAMGRRREELRVQGEKVEPAVRLTTEELLVRGQAILLQLSTDADDRVRKALRAELTSLAYALSARRE